MTVSLLGFDDSEIDWSFAICPRRQKNYLVSLPSCIKKRTSSLEDDFNVFDSEEYMTTAGDALSIDSARSVTFAEKIVSEVISVPRYEAESRSELFYNRYDVMKFRQEARLEETHQMPID